LFSVHLPVGEHTAVYLMSTRCNLRLHARRVTVYNV